MTSDSSPEIVSTRTRACGATFASSRIGFDPGHAGQPEVHHHDVGSTVRDDTDRPLAGRGFPHDLEIVFGQQPAQAAAKDIVIVDDHDTNRLSDLHRGCIDIRQAHLNGGG